MWHKMKQWKCDNNFELTQTHYIIKRKRAKERSGILPGLHLCNKNMRELRLTCWLVWINILTESVLLFSVRQYTTPVKTGFVSLVQNGKGIILKSFFVSFSVKAVLDPKQKVSLASSVRVSRANARKPDQEDLKGKL